MSSKRVIIIAEAGVNHNGDFDTAVEMIHKAKWAGADYVKFQTAVPELVISTFAPKAEYQKETTGNEQSQLEMCRAIHLPLSDYAKLKTICEQVGIGFMSTPFDLVSIDLLGELGMDYFKIPSGEITNLPYLRRIGALGAKVILSTGMSNMDEIAEAIYILNQAGTAYGDISLLHCNTQYPTPFEDVNLAVMSALREKFRLEVGYSDHTVGIDVPIAAVAMGATIVEKHFTLDCSMEGPDHRASLEPEALRAMVQGIRNIELAIGVGEKIATPSETPNIAIARKSIVAAKDIAKGEILTEANITTKRPGNGISPMQWDEVIGSVALRDFKYDELIEL
ncbi:MAG: N-acetylneuraminate synthase [Bacteroidales bacterium]